jgi:transcriptional regulator with XRE-family HTH domain
MSIRFFALTRYFFSTTVRLMEIGTVLADARRRAGIAQKDLARMLGISPQYLSDMEQGRRAFSDKFLPALPAEIRREVKAEFRTQYEALVAKYSDDA